MYYTVELEIEADVWVTISTTGSYEIAKATLDNHSNDVCRIIKHEVVEQSQ